MEFTPNFESLGLFMHLHSNYQNKLIRFLELLSKNNKPNLFVIRLELDGSTDVYFVNYDPKRGFVYIAWRRINDNFEDIRIEYTFILQEDSSWEISEYTGPERFNYDTSFFVIDNITELLADNVTTIPPYKE